MRSTLLLSVALALSVGAPSVLACKCAPPPPPGLNIVREPAGGTFQDTGVIFEGRVEKAELKWPGLDAPVGAIVRANGEEDPPTILVTFSVSRMYQGVAQPNVQVETGLGGGDCGYPFEIGKQYLVFADKRESGRLETGICTGTALLEDSTANLADLRGDPVPESAPSQPQGATGQLCARVVRDGATQADPDGVLLVSVNAASPLAADDAESDGKGSFCAADVRPGKYLLLFAPDGHESPVTFAYYPGVTKTSEATQIDIRAGQALSLVFRIPQQNTYSVRGKVATSGKSPVPDSQVVLVAADQPFRGPTYLADISEDGSFHIPKVLPGKYWGFVTVDDEGWSTRKAELVVDKDLDGVALVLIAGDPSQKR